MCAMILRVVTVGVVDLVDDDGAAAAAAAAAAACGRKLAGIACSE